MKLSFLSIVGFCVLLVACDKGGSDRGPLEKLFGAPTPTPVPTPVPTPKPKSGAWMFEKDHGNPLDQPTRKK